MSSRDSAGPSTSRLGRRYALLAGGLFALIFLLAILEQVGVPRAVIGYLFVFLTLVVYAGIGIASRTMQVSQYYVAGREVPTIYNGMAAGADWLSAATFIGLGGTLYALGYDGLAYVLGLSGGYVLVAVLIAPYLRKFGAYTVPDFLAARFGGNFARLVGVIVLLCCSFTLAVAQMYGAGLIASRFLGVSFEVAVALALVTILLSSTLGGMRAVTWAQVAQYIVLIVAYLFPVILLSARMYGLPIPQLTYGQALQDIAALENGMLQGAAAGAAPPHLQPFANIDPFNFFALIFCLMLGTASLPHVLMRYFTTPTVRGARKSVAWSHLFIVLLCLTAPAYAAFAKLEVYQNVVGVAPEALPQWIYTYGQLGLVQVCGVDATASDVVLAACSASGGDGVLGLADLTINRDVIVIATPEIAGLPYVITALVAAGGLAAALSSASGLLLAIANAFSHDIYFRMIDTKAPTGRRLLAARISLVAVAGGAAWVASSRPADILSMVAWSFSLAAAGNFAPLVLGIWWKRCTAAGAIAGMIAGFGLTLAYLLMTEYGGMLPLGLPGLTSGVEGISAAVIGLPVAMLVTIMISLLTPAPSPEMQDFVDEVRRPRGEPMMEERPV